MKNVRRGLGKGKGTGYKNMMPSDSYIHGLSGRGIVTYRRPIQMFRAELKKEHIKPFALPVQTAVLVPSTTKGDKPITKKQYKARVIEVHNKLYDLFGGFTSVEGVGAVEDVNTGMPIQEPVNVVTAYTTKKKFSDKEEDFITFVENKKKQWGQQSMGVIIENDLLFI